MIELHRAYAPILRFAKGERLFPLACRGLCALQQLVCQRPGRAVGAPGKSDARSTTPQGTFVGGVPALGGRRPLAGIGGGCPLGQANHRHGVPVGTENDDVPWLTAYRGSWGTRYWLPLDRARAILGALASVSPALRLVFSAAPREIELPGISAPHGPRIGDSGEQRPRWAGPVEWAGVPPD